MPSSNDLLQQLVDIGKEGSDPDKTSADTLKELLSIARRIQRNGLLGGLATSARSSVPSKIIETVQETGIRLIAERIARGQNRSGNSPIVHKHYYRKTKSQSQAQVMAKAAGAESDEGKPIDSGSKPKFTFIPPRTASDQAEKKKKDILHRAETFDEELRKTNLPKTNIEGGIVPKKTIQATEKATSSLFEKFDKGMQKIGGKMFDTLEKGVNKLGGWKKVGSIAGAIGAGWETGKAVGGFIGAEGTPASIGPPLEHRNAAMVNAMNKYHTMTWATIGLGTLPARGLYDLFAGGGVFQGSNDKGIK